MKSAKKLILALLAFAGLCVVCAVFGAAAYSAGQSTQPPAVPGSTQVIVLPTAVKEVEEVSASASGSSGACAVKVYFVAGSFDATVYEVVTGPGSDTICQEALDDLSGTETDPSLHVELSVIDYDPGLTAYCERQIGKLKIEIQADDESMATRFCDSLLKK